MMRPVTFNKVCILRQRTHDIDSFLTRMWCAESYKTIGAGRFTILKHAIRHLKGNYDLRNDLRNINIYQNIVSIFYIFRKKNIDINF